MMIFPFPLLPLSLSPFASLSHSLIIVVFLPFLSIVLKNASIHIDEGHWEKKERGDFSSAYLLLFHSLFFSVTIFLECIAASVCVCVNTTVIVLIKRSVFLRLFSFFFLYKCAYSFFQIIITNAIQSSTTITIITHLFYSYSNNILNAICDYISNNSPSHAFFFFLFVFSINSK